MKRFSLIVAIVICVILTSCSLVTSTKKSEVYGTVTKMEYKEKSLFYNVALEMYQIIPEKYLVTITYKGIRETIDSQTLYEKYKEGDKVKVILCNSYDQEGNLVCQKLEIPE